jgi:hypothetical protein
MITIIWDIDDVLNNLMEAWFEQYWKPYHHQCDLTYADLVENPPHRVIGVSREEYLSSLDEFRMSGAEARLVPNAKIVAWLNAHGRRFRHFALTARPLETVPFQAEWLFRNFSPFIRGYGVVPSRSSPSTPVYDLTKGEYLRWLGMGDILVDDNEDNIAQALQVGVSAILFPQPWNQSAFSILEVLDKIESGAAAGTDYRRRSTLHHL